MCGVQHCPSYPSECPYVKNSELNSAFTDLQVLYLEVFCLSSARCDAGHSPSWVMYILKDFIYRG